MVKMHSEIANLLTHLFDNVFVNLFIAEQFLTSAKALWLAVPREGTTGCAWF